MKKYAFLTVLLLIFSQQIPAQTTGWAGASWIWDEPGANTITQSNEPRYLRLAFDLPTPAKSAELWVTVDNHYVAYVNGTKVGADSEWATIEKYDVAKHLVVGKNVVAIKATNQGGAAGAIARLQIKTDKSELIIATNDKTKITQKAPAGWETASFDDSAWFNAVILGDSSIGPWNLAGGAVGKGKGKKGGQFGYDTNETVPVKGRLSAQEQMKHFVVPKDFEIELVAADPVIINPITMVMDDQGRLIVSESHTYRYGPPGSPIKPYANPVIRLDPDGKGSFTRTLIADGFADPVMGIAVKGDKLWLTANNYLYTYDLPASPPSPQRGRGAGDEGAVPQATTASNENRGQPTSTSGAAPSPPTPLPQGERGEKTPPQPIDKGKPLATNKKTIVTDLNKAWNPFGMFVLEWGPDGKLYMSVGNHPINLQGPDKDKMSGKGSSGIIVRMNPDGSKMERLVHGLRVPYSFEYDPFGQLWLLSNGEGNPNRFVRVIEGVDYHCYSRGAVDNNWLAGNHPLAPPCEELHRGADTQLMRYYGAAYPEEYQGNLFLCNWGAHGFAGPNRGIFRFVPDERNNIVKREPLVWCKDPYFRPSHILLDRDGSLLIADWYGRDDESDLTGRIWRLKYVGKNAPVVKQKLDSDEWKNDDYAISALGSPSHLIREKAMDLALKRTDIARLAEYAATTKESLGAANALWALVRVGSVSSLPKGLKNSDWKVRRLATNLIGRIPPHNEKESEALVAALQPSMKDSDPAVQLEAEKALAPIPIADMRFALTLTRGAAKDVHLRYEAAWHLAKHADGIPALHALLTSDDPDVRLAGLIAIDIACYENFPSKKAALAALNAALADPGKLDHQLLLTVAQLNGDATILPGLEKLLSRDDLPTATIAKAVLVLKSKAGGNLASAKLSAAAGKRLIEAVEKGQLKIASPGDQLVIFEFLESEGPTPFALKQIGGQLQSSNKDLRLAAHTLARRFGAKADALADPLWPSVLNAKTKFDDAIEALSTIARVENTSKKERWAQLLKHDDPLVRMEAVRWWRRFEKQPAFIGIFIDRAEELQKKDANIADDIRMVSRHLSGKTIDKVMSKDDLAKVAFEELTKMPAGDRAKRAAMGQQVFERNACTKCHTTATATTPLAPSLKGIAQQKVDYLIESVLFPSKVIKTGWEVESIELKSGKTLTGLVKDEGKHLRVLNIDKEERILKSDIESRAVSKISVMPEGQEATLSRREFVDLITYLQTLK